MKVRQMKAENNATIDKLLKDGAYQVATIYGRSYTCHLANLLGAR